MSVFNYIYSFIHKPPAVQTLEPMCCMIRLAMLAFRDVGTKISINNNTITIIQPSIIQGTVRWTHGDTRQDLHHLLHPIIKAIELYDINLPYIFNIFKYTSIGLTKLKSSYNDDSSIICHSLIHYISIVDKALEAKLTKKPDLEPPKKPDAEPSKKPDIELSKKQSKKPEVEQKKPEVEQKKPEVEQKKPEVEQKKPDVDIRERSVSIESDLSSILYKNFKELWTEEQLLLINNLLEESFRHSKESNSYLDAIDTIVKVKEASACEIIANNTITL
jgi:hypothetical protein